MFGEDFNPDSLKIKTSRATTKVDFKSKKDDEVTYASPHDSARFQADIDREKSAPFLMKGQGGHISHRLRGMTARVPGHRTIR